MSVVGIDIGNCNSVVAVVRARGVEVVANEVSKRETASQAGLGSAERLLGEAAASQRMQNLKATVDNMKLLLGRSFDDPVVQDLKGRVPFTIEQAADGSDGIELVLQQGADKKRMLPEQMMAMLLYRLKAMAEDHLQSPVKDVVLSCPAYYSERQRSALMAAARIAGLHVMRLLSDGAAAALSANMFDMTLPKVAKDSKKDSTTGLFKDADGNDVTPRRSLIVDLGHSAVSATLVEAVDGRQRTLSAVCDTSLGAAHLDNALVDHLAGEFKKTKGIDVNENARAKQRLTVQVERMKRVLSANPMAPLNVECLMNDVDVSAKVKREDFEEMCADVLKRSAEPALKALELAGLTADDLTSVQIIGGGSRVPAVQQALTDALGGKTLQRTLDASEAVAKGCALMCAIMSPAFKTRDMTVDDAQGESLQVGWDLYETGASEALPSKPMVLFERGCAVPSLRRITFQPCDRIVLTGQYEDGTKVGDFEVKDVPAVSENVIGKPELKVMMRVDASGRLTLRSATLVQTVEEEVEVEVEVDIPADELEQMKKERAEEEAKEAKEAEEAAAAAAAAAVAAAEGEGGDDMDAETTKPAPAAAKKPASKKPLPTKRKEKQKKMKKLVRKLPAAIVTRREHELSTERVEKLRAAEVEMEKADAAIIETNEMRNEVEAYVYAMRDKVLGSLYDYAADSQRDAFKEKLSGTENWLYDEGENATKDVYAAKLAELKAEGDPIERRQAEADGREMALETLEFAVKRNRELADSTDEKYAHIGEEDRAKVRAECDQADEWFKQTRDKLAAVAKHEDAPVRNFEITAKAGELDGKVKPIMNKAKPKETPPPPGNSTKAAGADKAADSGDKAGEEDMEVEGGSKEGEAEAGADAGADAPPAADMEVEDVDA